MNWPLAAAVFSIFSVGYLEAAPRFFPRGKWIPTYLFYLDIASYTVPPRLPALSTYLIYTHSLTTPPPN